jgi:hypothetical protein
LWGLKVEENWEKDRRDRVNQLLHLWNRLEKNIDPNFDFNDINNRLKGNVPVPAPNYIPGITPESIKDPEIRRKYEKAIEINKQKAFKYNEQIILHKINKQFDEFVEKFLIDMYSEPPFNTAELSKFLKSFKIEGEFKFDKSILWTVIMRVQNTDALNFRLTPMPLIVFGKLLSLTKR